MKEIELKEAKVDLTGIRKGCLVISKRAPDIIGYHNIRKEMWYANCDCGTENFLVSASEFKRNHIKSCGCLRKKDHIGEKYGRLLIVKKAEPQICKHGKKDRYYCNCDCGNKNILVYMSNLKAGYTKSCGCLKQESIIQRCRKKNEYIDNGDYYTGITNNGEEFYFDKEDYEKVCQYCWNKDKQGRIVANTHYDDKDSGCDIKLHRLIMNVNDSNFVVDHKNHNQCDNRKANLRIVTVSENMMNLSLKSNNTSGYPGVGWNKRKNKWYARITENGNIHWLGYYTDFNEAVTIRKEAEEKYFGEYSYKNSTGGYVNEENIS